MASDPFAAIRREPAEVSTSYADAVVSPVVTRPYPHEGYEKTAEICGVTQVTPVTPPNIEGRSWRDLAADLVAEWGMPLAWAEGIAALQLMAMPDGATVDRWAQIVDDATTFARRWHAQAIEAGWTMDDVFGFDPDDEDTSFALVVNIRGGRPLMLAGGTCAVIAGDRTRYFYPGHGKAGTPPIWMINRNRRRRAKERESSHE